MSKPTANGSRTPRTLGAPAGRAKVKAATQERRGGVAPMSQVMASFLQVAGLDRNLGEQRVLTAWHAVLGTSKAQRARAVRFREGELIVEVASAALLQELKNFTGETLRKAANKKLGQERIRRVSYQPKR